MGIKRLNTLQKDSDIINLTSAIGDYRLAVGETAIIAYDSVTEVPLKIASTEGIYEISISGDQTKTISTAGEIKLKPNNALVSAGLIDYVRQGNPISINSSSGTISQFTDGSGVSATAFNVGNDLACKVDMKISTFTKSKTVHSVTFVRGSSTQYYYITYFNNWFDTDTAWISLGTMVFAFAQSGNITIRRIV